MFPSVPRRQAYVTNCRCEERLGDRYGDQTTVVATVGVEFIPVHVSISPDGVHAMRDQCRLELGIGHRTSPPIR